MEIAGKCTWISPLNVAVDRRWKSDLAYQAQRRSQFHALDCRGIPRLLECFERS